MDARPDHSLRRWLARFAWLALFWVAGVAALGLVAWLLKLAMNAVGMSPRYSGSADARTVVSAAVMGGCRAVPAVPGVVGRPGAGACRFATLARADNGVHVSVGDTAVRIAH